MTATSEPLMPPAHQPLLPEVRPTFYDRWRARLDADPRVHRVWSLLAPLLVTVLAAVLRFWNLGHPHALVFDETYYVKDAWSQWNLGFPATWPEGADERFPAGETDIFSTNASYAVHPPLGKWIIGAGMALFGPDDPFGWRFSVALFGTATVLVLYFLARALGGSIVYASVAALFLAVDGLGIVLSRVGILDGLLTFFVVLAFWFVVLDRRRHRRRLESWMAAKTVEGIAPAWGPVFWNRPWLVAAGAALGAATAVKWSGLYVLAAVGIYVVVDDALARRRAGIGYWPTDAALRQGLASFVLFVPIAFAVYLASWTGWLVTDGGYDRQSATGAPATGVWAWVPLPLQSLWHYHQSIYSSNLNITAPHGYASPAWQWPLLLRPTSMYYLGSATGENGCTAGGNGCSENITSIANPLLWWLAVIATVYLLWRAFAKRDGGYALVLTGITATYLPWLFYPDRTIFQFYTVVIMPFLILALTTMLRDLAQVRTERGTPLGRWTTVAVIAAVLAVSAWYYPVWTAVQVPYDFWFLHFNRAGWI